MTRRRIPATLAAAGVLIALTACGGDDDDDAAATTLVATETSEPAATEPAQDGGGPTTTEQAGGDDQTADFCALAEKLAAAEGFPTAKQAASYASLAPDAIRGQAETAVGVYVEHEGDDVAIFVAMSADEVEDAGRELNAFETEQCGIDNSEVTIEAVDVDDSANRVDITATEYATEYAFEFPTSIPAGPTSLVLTNEGAEAHFMMVFRVEPGHTMQEALEFEGDPAEAGIITDLQLESGFAAPDGQDEEVINADFAPGDYALVCFLPGPDGTPHAFHGMATAFTVE